MILYISAFSFLLVLVGAEGFPKFRPFFFVIEVPSEARYEMEKKKDSRRIIMRRKREEKKGRSSTLLVL